MRRSLFAVIRYDVLILGTRRIWSVVGVALLTGAVSACGAAASSSSSAALSGSPVTTSAVPSSSQAPSSSVSSSAPATSAAPATTAAQQSSSAAAGSLLPPPGQTSYFQIGNPTFNQASGVGDVNGAQIQFSTEQAEEAVANVFQATLFEIESNGTVTVYSPGWSPVSTTLTQNSDGTYGIAYQEQSSNSTASFNAKLNSSQIGVGYQQEGAGGNFVDGQENVAGRNFGGSFTAPVIWVNASNIPGSPTNLQIQGENGTLVLNWSPAAGNVSHYVIDRLIGIANSSPVYVSSTTSTTFDDTTALSMTPAGGDEIFYYVYAVGPTGVVNPTDAFGYINTS
jgi:hypothetical protein